MIISPIKADHCGAPRFCATTECNWPQSFKVLNSTPKPNPYPKPALRIIYELCKPKPKLETCYSKPTPKPNLKL